MSPFLRVVCCGLLLTTSCTEGEEAGRRVGRAPDGAPAGVGASASATSIRPAAAKTGESASPAAPQASPAAPQASPAAPQASPPAPQASPPPEVSVAAGGAGGGAERASSSWVPWGAPTPAPGGGPANAAVEAAERAPAKASQPASPPVDRAPRQATPPTTDLVTMRDPVEDAYTVGMPRGWHNQTHSVRVFDVHSSMLTSVSPDGSVVIFSGDPGLPNYYSPAHATPVTHDMARVHPRVEVRSFVPAATYFPAYVRRKFGALPGFELVSVEADAAAAERLRATFAEHGRQASPTVANVSFRYTEAGAAMSALVLGATIDSGPFWTVTVSGIATEGDPRRYVPMLDAIGRSYRSNPDWQAEQQRRHQERMARIEQLSRQSTAQHQQNMAALQQGARLHQERMRALQAQGDASARSYRERMAADDAQHRSFLNYVNEERTVVDPGGKTYQVTSGYERYFVNRLDGTYVGGDQGMGPEALRALGLDPSQYDEVKITR